MDLDTRLTELARIGGAATPVVSVYLNTRWADEHQRERVRIFLKNEIQDARQAHGGPALDADLDWIREQAEALIEQARFPDAHGVALFACQAIDLREILPMRVPFEDTLVVSDSPYLRPLAAALEATPSVLIVFVDSEAARLIRVSHEGTDEETRLESEVPGHHRRGGWAMLAQSRYQRHIQDHRGRHFEAVAAALVHLVDTLGVERIVIAGEPRNVSVFRQHLPQRLAGRIAGTVPGARYEPAAAFLERARDLLARVEQRQQAEAVDAVLTEAAKGGRAVVGLRATIEAAARGAVHRLHVLRGFSHPGAVCVECGALQSGEGRTCRPCGKEARPAEIGSVLVDRVLAADGKVETIESHDELARSGGIAARLRYPL